MSGMERDDRPEESGTRGPDKPANIAPDAVKNPNEKTEGKPGLGHQGERRKGEADPGGS